MHGSKLNEQSHDNALNAKLIYTGEYVHIFMQNGICQEKYFKINCASFQSWIDPWPDTLAVEDKYNVVK